MSQFPQLAEKNENALTATIKTNKGDITVRLFPEHAPKTVENFIGLAEKGYYDGVIFHRVIPNFMIFNLKGALSMANAGPGTNSSQFFIVTMSELPEQMIPQLEQAGFPEEIINAYKQNGGTPWLDQKHTVFGQVVNGYEVAETIENVERNAMDKPNEDVVIETIEVHN